MDVSAAFFISTAILWILVIFQSLVLLGLVRIVHGLQGGAGTAEEQSPREGEVAADFTAVDLDGKSFQSSSLSGRMRALLFVSPDCRSCMTTLEELRALELKTKGALAVICRGSVEQCKTLAESFHLDSRVIADEDHLISGLYKVDLVPMAVLISPDDHIQSYGSPLREDLEQIAGTISSSEQAG